MDSKRLRERDAQGELLSLAAFSFTLPQKLGLEVDALCTFTGQGEDVRITYPAQMYWENQETKNRFFLIPGHHKAEQHWRDMTPEVLAGEPFNIKKLEGVIVTPPLITTRDQAEWIVAQIQELRITSLGVISSPFHLLRAYLTVLGQMKAAGIRIPVIPIPVYVAPHIVVPEQGVEAWELVQGEAERIAAYQKKGDVASYSDLKEYLHWLWEQPLLMRASGTKDGLQADITSYTI